MFEVSLTEGKEEGESLVVGWFIHDVGEYSRRWVFCQEAWLLGWQAWRNLEVLKSGLEDWSVGRIASMAVSLWLSSLMVAMLSAIALKCLRVILEGWVMYDFIMVWIV